MKTDFDWRDCVLVYPSNADFLRGKIMRIRDDIWHPFDVVHHTVGYFFAFGFFAQFLLKNQTFLLISSLMAGVFVGALKFRSGKIAVSRRGEGQLLQGELLLAKSDKSESEGTILIYRIISDAECGPEIKGYVDLKPESFPPGDKLVILRTFDGECAVL